MINNETGQTFFVGEYDSKKESMTVTSGLQTIEHGNAYRWAAIGNNGPDVDATSRLLTVAYIAVPSAPTFLSLVRSLSWDAKTSQLVSYPVVEYEKLRSATLFAGRNLSIESGRNETLPVPASAGGALDLQASFELTDVLRGFGVSVRSGDVSVRVDVVQKSSAGFKATVTFLPNAPPPPPPDATGHLGSEMPPLMSKTVSVQVLVGETLDIRVIVDRPVVEIFINQGRAAFVAGALKPFSADRLEVSLFNAGPPVPATVEAHEMGCGWAQSRPEPRPPAIKADDEAAFDLLVPQCNE